MDGTCVCTPGSSFCGVDCVDLDTDLEHCGTCTNTCFATQSCDSGACSCAADETLCTDTCANLATDAANCGQCGHACPSDHECYDGACQRVLATFPSTFTSGGLAANSSRLYWIDFNGHSLWSISQYGTATPMMIASGQLLARGLYVTEAYVYWLFTYQAGGSYGGQLERVPATGGSIQGWAPGITVLCVNCPYTHTGGDHQFVVDAADAFVYFLNGQGALMRFSLSPGGMPQQVTTAPGANMLAMNSAYYLWSSASTSMLYSVPIATPQPKAIGSWRYQSFFAADDQALYYPGTTSIWSSTMNGTATNLSQALTTQGLALSEVVIDGSYAYGLGYSAGSDRIVKVPKSGGPVTDIVGSPSMHSAATYEWLVNYGLYIYVFRRDSAGVALVEIPKN